MRSLFACALGVAAVHADYYDKFDHYELQHEHAHDQPHSYEYSHEPHHYYHEKEPEHHEPVTHAYHEAPHQTYYEHEEYRTYSRPERHYEESEPYYSHYANYMSNAVGVTINENGRDLQLYAVGAGQQNYGGHQWASTGRGYLITGPDLNKGSPNFYMPNMVGGTLEYDIDLSKHECGCVATFYQVAMPGKYGSGVPHWETDGFGYCDAPGWGGAEKCPEFDIMEANK